MLTPQEVSTHAFAKAAFNGYSMTMVDEFLDELTEDYTSLYKENAVLKAKMKVMVEKVEEYRATEDSMRAALLAAQKMADSIVKEAEAKRDEILAQAERDARDKTEASEREAVAIEERIREGRESMARFLSASRDLCAEQQKFLDQLPTMEVLHDSEPVHIDEPREDPAPDHQETVQEIQETVLELLEDIDAPDSAETVDAVDADPAGDDQGAETVFRLDELKFGRREREASGD